MNLKYEIGQTVEVEHIETVESTIIKREKATINSITVGKDGVAKYLTSMGAFTETSLDAFKQPIKPAVCAESAPKLIVTRDMLVKLNACSAGLAEFDRFFPNGSGEFKAVYGVTGSANGRWLIARKPQIEAMQNQPKQEAVTLYCVKDNRPNFTKGNTCVFDGQMHYESYVGCPYPSFEDWKRNNPAIAACLIRAEKRPAKVGEWVLMVVETVQHNPPLAIGEVCKVVEDGNGVISRYIVTDKGNRFYDAAHLDEYLVLPDYIPEKVEPEYYNGKVVCVDNDYSKQLTVGKVYTFKDGKTYYNDGTTLPFWESAIKSLADLNSRSSFKFIEYRGEQLC